jgi:hypothetical protein
MRKDACSPSEPTDVVLDPRSPDLRLLDRLRWIANASRCRLTDCRRAHSKYVDLANSYWDEHVTVEGDAAAVCLCNTEG